MTATEHNGIVLRRERRARKLTQEQMSSKMGVSVRTYIRFEQRGAPNPVAILAGYLLREIPVQPQRQSTRPSI